MTETHCDSLCQRDNVEGNKVMGDSSPGSMRCWLLLFYPSNITDLDVGKTTINHESGVTVHLS